MVSFSQNETCCATRKKRQAQVNAKSHPLQNEPQFLCFCGTYVYVEHPYCLRSPSTPRNRQCRECRKDYDRRRYEADRDEILAQQRGYKQAHPEIGWAADHRRRARSYELQLVRTGPRRRHL
jgi:hypothetical protein